MCFAEEIIIIFRGWQKDESGKKRLYAPDRFEGKPSSKEDFLRQFEAYCVKENIDLVYEVKDVPAVVLMNGVRCEVSLDSTPGFGGADYVMKVTER